MNPNIMLVQVGNEFINFADVSRIYFTTATKRLSPLTDDIGPVLVGVVWFKGLPQVNETGRQFEGDSAKQLMEACSAFQIAFAQPGPIGPAQTQN